MKQSDIPAEAWLKAWRNRCRRARKIIKNSFMPNAYAQDRLTWLEGFLREAKEYAAGEPKDPTHDNS